MLIENIELVHKIKNTFAPDRGLCGEYDNREGDAAYCEHNASDNTLGFGLIHYSFVTNIKPKKVLVIGSRYGYIPAIISLALKAIGGGELDFVDANYSDKKDGFDVAYGGVGYWSDENDYKKGFKDLGLLDIINFHIMRTDEFFSNCKSTYGYVYIDGDHSYDGTKYDFRESSNRLTKDGIIAMHDIYHLSPPFGAVKTFFEVDENEYNKMIVPVGWPFDNPSISNDGLALIQPKDGEKLLFKDAEKRI